MRKHTTVNLDPELLREAAGVLGTARTMDTIHAALADVVRRGSRMAILTLRPDLDIRDIDAMRSDRFAGQGPRDQNRLA